MEDPQTWQDLLRSIISEQAELHRIAREMGVNPITLTRWANRISLPRMANLRPLLDAIPRQRSKMQLLLQKDFPKMVAENIPEERVVPEIPSPFYSSILNIFTTSPPLLRSPTIFVAIFQQILRQLDPLKQGLQVVICQCVPPAPGEKVRSLRFMQGRATSPWENYTEDFMTFLGLESQICNAVIHGHAIITQSEKEHEARYPGHKIPLVESIAAYPLLYFDRVAGALAVFSTQKNYFTPAHMELMQSYTELLILAFEQEQFYSLHEIALDIMPSSEEQQIYLQGFRPLVTEIMLESERNGSLIKRTEAELHAWKLIERRLLNLHR